MVKYGNIYYNIPKPYHKKFKEILFCITCGQKNSPSRQKGLILHTSSNLLYPPS